MRRGLPPRVQTLPASLALSKRALPWLPVEVLPTSPTTDRRKSRDIHLKIYTKRRTSPIRIYSGKCVVTYIIYGVSNAQQTTEYSHKYISITNKISMTYFLLR